MLLIDEQQSWGVVTWAFLLSLMNSSPTAAVSWAAETNTTPDVKSFYVIIQQ